MPQPKKGPRLGSGPKHQRQLLSNLALSLFEHERVTTTEAKAKMLRPFAERLITKAKDGSVHKRRQVLSVIEDRAVVHKLFADIGPRFADRNGGYTRILKLGPRNGDGAPMALIELVEEGAAQRVADPEDETGALRRRLSRPTRKKTPEDKPVQSQAAEAAAAGTPDDAGEVEPPDEVAAETTEAAQAAADASAQAATDDAEVADLPADPGAPGAEGGAGGVPEGGLPEDKSDTT